MRRKLTATICALGVLGTAGIAFAAAPVAIAIFPFDSAADMTNFTKVEGDKCNKKLRKSKAMGINVGEGTIQCVFRTSVVADSSDTLPYQDIQASVGYEAKTPTALQAKLYLGVLVRASATSGYELRVIPFKQRWVVIRDPEGAVTDQTLKAGTAKFINPKPAKLNVLRLRVDATGTLVASINGKTVFTTVEPATTAPTGKFTEIAVGNKKPGATAAGMLGTFDDVTIRIPSPF